MNIAILGGAFDPPHLGHYFVATQVKELLPIDEVWLMPCYSYFPEFPVKYSHITEPSVRFKMAKSFEKYGIKVSDFEHKFNKESRTSETLLLLRKHYPQHVFSFIIGSDTLPSFRLWNDWKRMVNEENLIIFPRDTDFKTLEDRVLEAFAIPSLPGNIQIMEGSLIVSNIASTHIRKRVRAGLPVSSFVPEDVERYIKELELYVK